MYQDHNNPVRKFAYEMMQELEQHDSQNEIKFYDLNCEQTKKLLETQFLKRMPIIMNSNDPIEIDKQVTHLANFCYFVWTRCR